MNTGTGEIKSGFTYNVEHIRSVDKMVELGLSVTGLQRKSFNGVDSVVLSEETVKNLIPIQGLNYMLGTALKGVSQSAAWYIAPFEANYTPVDSVTAASFTADATESVAYDELARVTWTPGAIAGGVVSNSASQAVFTMNASKTIYGIGQLSVATKSSTSGTLISCAAFAAAKVVVATDILNVTSTITATSA